jgi:hypothetical protein
MMRASHFPEEGTLLSKPDNVKTSLRIRYDLWQTAKTFALSQGIELQDVVNDALESYLPKDVVISVVSKKRSTR